MSKKVYPQDIEGRYRRIKNYSIIALLVVYFFGSWLRYERGEGLPDQALLIDLPNRTAYFFGIEIWPQEAYYITGILIIAALGLFFFTSLFGRVWCGYTCPQTVFTDIFVKVEKYFQGDRNARIKLDSTPYNADKLKRKFLTYMTWALMAFAFAFGWVSYFYDVFQLMHDLVNFNLGASATTWLLGLTASTFLFAGFLREKVCTYMCPYGRFQSAMLDNDTTVVTYHSWRGEPRRDGGDCIDCGKCVFVCPMGIDIRNGLQLECIGCGLCIDACNSVMEKVNKPLGLISYASINGTELIKSGKTPKHLFFRAKTAIFGFVFMVVASIMFYSLLTKGSFELSFERERGPLFTITPDGDIRNTYMLKVFNKSMHQKEVLLKLKGLDGAKFMLQDITGYVDYYYFTIQPGGEFESKVFIKIEDAKKITSNQNIKLFLHDNATGESMHKDAIFIVKR